MRIHVLTHVSNSSLPFRIALFLCFLGYMNQEKELLMLVNLRTSLESLNLMLESIGIICNIFQKISPTLYISRPLFIFFRRAIIADALNDMMKKTCFKFIGRTSQTAYVRIMRGSGCYRYSYLEQIIKL